MFAGGVATFWEGGFFGVVGGSWLVARVIDDIVTSARNIYNQTPGRPTFIQGTITAWTGSETAGMLITMAINLTGGRVRFRPALLPLCSVTSSERTSTRPQSPGW
jgi:hypothetical protein